MPVDLIVPPTTSRAAFGAWARQPGDETRHHLFTDCCQRQAKQNTYGADAAGSTLHVTQSYPALISIVYFDSPLPGSRSGQYLLNGPRSTSWLILVPGKKSDSNWRGADIIDIGIASVESKNHFDVCQNRITKRNPKNERHDISEKIQAPDNRRSDSPFADDRTIGPSPKRSRGRWRRRRW
jgi:hypothetical protein